jgi:hypothetical protein
VANFGNIYGKIWYLTSLTLWLLPNTYCITICIINTTTRSCTRGLPWRRCLSLSCQRIAVFAMASSGEMYSHTSCVPGTLITVRTATVTCWHCGKLENYTVPVITPFVFEFLTSYCGGGLTWWLHWWVLNDCLTNPVDISTVIEVKKNLSSILVWIIRNSRSQWQRGLRRWSAA